MRTCLNCANMKIPEYEAVDCQTCGDDTALSGWKPMSVNNIQHGGTHYKDKSIQPWDYIAANKLDYFEGNVVKYVSRWRDKGGIDDLHKARHYLDKLIELETGA